MADRTIEVELPNKQRTVINVRPGLTLKEALKKALKVRGIDPNKVQVYLLLSGDDGAEQPLSLNHPAERLIGKKLKVVPL
uniref:Designed protein dRafX6 n=1 Tax=synthetic construct TaxID=32630 RepID=UPI000F62C1EA|nr:Chain A, Designed protein dRafX6 [synthetic construct]